MKLTKAQIKGKQEELVGNLVNPVEKGSTTGACARPRKPPSRSIALRRLASVAAHRLGRQAVRRAPLVRHPSGTTARRTRKPPEAVHENACFAGCTKRSEMLPLLPIPIPSFQLATLALAIGNIYTLVLQAPLPSIPTFSRRPRSGRFRVARRGLSCLAVRRGPTGLKEGATPTARRSLKP